MKLPLLGNVFSVLLAVVVSAGVSLLLNKIESLNTTSFVFSLLFYAVLFLAFNAFYAYYKGHESFISLLLGGIVVRLLLTLILIVICRVISINDFFPFTIHLICHYVLFTFIEIKYLLTLIKSNRS
jgi:low temperature requirement protein LtrA